VEPAYREAIQAAKVKAIGAGLSKSVGAQIIPPCAPDAGHMLQDLMFALLGVGLDLVLFLLSMHLFLPLESECLLCATVLWKYITSFLFLQDITAKSCLDSQRIIWA
jgi:hypothetical protein